ncbi:MAG TPA: SUMF1/EgtB/PvdO family nonheme iron enzyme [Fimbriiglobus sp.]
MWAAPFALRYVNNTAQIKIEQTDGWESIIAYNDQGVATDTFSVKYSPTIDLPPGRYRLEPILTPGRAIASWELTTSGLFSFEMGTITGPSSPVIVVKRGERLTIRAVLREAPSVQPSPNPEIGFVPLFNGKDLTGWSTAPGHANVWSVVDGTLVGRSPAGKDSYSFLGTERQDYADFHLSAEVKIGAEGNSGIYFRAAANTPRLPLGYEAQICIQKGAGNLTGSIGLNLGGTWQTLALVTKPTHQPDQWFTFEIIAQGTRLETRVNGNAVATRLDAVRHSGGIFLEASPSTPRVEFRNIKIKELPAEVPPPPAAGLIDLIQLARPEDSHGTWAVENGKLVHPARKFPYVTCVPIAVSAPDEYDLEAEVERTAGADYISFGMSAFGRQFMVGLDAFGEWAGIADVAGEGLDRNPTRRKGPWLINGKRHTFRCEVRASGVRAWLDGRPVVEYRDGFERLSTKRHGLPAGAKFALVCENGCGFTVHRLTLTPRKGLDPPPPLAVAPFDAAKAKELQEAWAKHLGVPVELTNGIGMKLRLIPPGIARGGHWSGLWPGPGRKIDRPYYLGACEVTVGQFRRFVRETNYKTTAELTGKGGFGPKRSFAPEHVWSNPAFAPGDDYPVGLVTRADAAAFCAWLSRKDGRTYRLPWSYERMWAADAGEVSAPLVVPDDCAWHDKNSAGHSHPVGQKKPNPWGLYDVHGNLAEWVYERRRAGRPVDPADGSPPANEHDVHWGGAFTSPPKWISGSTPHDYALYDIGFRVALVGDLKPKPPPPPAVAPFDAAKAQEHQAAWSKYLGVPVEYTNSIGMKFRIIPPGEFSMGMTKDEIAALTKEAEGEMNKDFYAIHFSWSGPAQKIRLTKPYYFGRVGVTVAEFRAFADATGYKTRAEKRNAEGQGRNTIPTWRDRGLTIDGEVSWISWNDALAFCQWLTAKEGLEYTLPTEAQWEFVSRGGITGPLPSQANIRAAGRGPHPFGIIPSTFAEWCLDPWDPDYYRRGFTDDPLGRTVAGTNRSNRGGPFTYGGHPAVRKSAHADTVLSALGFRVAIVGDLNPKPAAAPAAGPKPPAPAVAPFDAPKAQEHQREWAKHVGVPEEMTNSIGMKLRLIPPGSFTMGSSPAEVDRLLKETEYKSAPPWVQEGVRSEGPDRRVTIREPFYLGTYEVTVGQFREFARATGYKSEAETNGGGSIWDIGAKDWRRDPEYIWTNPKFAASESHPVVFMTPKDARAFCKWLSEKDGRRYEIPTEEQWEWACRAGTDTRWFFGDDAKGMKEFGWTMPLADGLNHPVGRLSANPFGLRDVYGNAIELAFTPQGRPMDRGGDAGMSAWRSRSASRYEANHPDETNFRRGFRVAATGNLKGSSSRTPTTAPPPQEKP